MSFFTVAKELHRDLKMKGRDIRMFQKGIAKNYRARLKCDAELGETEFVLKELDSLKEDAIVYKLVGPILVKQERTEPNANVRKRIGDLVAQLKHVDDIIVELEKKHIRKSQTISMVGRRLRSLERGEPNA